MVKCINDATNRWQGYDIANCVGCVPSIDWSAETQRKTKVVTSRQRKTFQRDGVVILPAAIAAEKVKQLATEVEAMSDTIMTTLLAKFLLQQYSKYEHKLDTRSGLVRDWAVHGPLATWAAELMDVKTVRLYNVEKIYSAGMDNPRGCGTAWHRDTIAAPFPTTTKSITFNVYLDAIGVDAPQGDVLIYSKGSQHNLQTPPVDITKNVLEPQLHVGDIVAHAPHIYHTPSGRGCWHRRSLQFRYVAAPTTFTFAPHRFPHGPIPWTLAHAAGIAPHGLVEGQVLAGPWYPQVYPTPLTTEEHIPIVGGHPWSLWGLLGVSQQALASAAALGIGNREQCTLPDQDGVDENNYAYYGFDGPVIACQDWELWNGVPVHKDGQMKQSLRLN